MATTLRTELTKAGCNVSTATILYQPGIGQLPSIGSPTKQVPTKAAIPAAVTLAPTDARLDARFIQRQEQSAPRCMAIDGTSIYVWIALPTSQPGFMKILSTAAPYTAGTAILPVIADF